MLANRKTDWRNRSNVGIIKRLMGFHESPEEILACSCDYNVAVVGCFNCVIAGLGGGTVYLYFILDMFGFIS